MGKSPVQPILALGGGVVWTKLGERAFAYTDMVDKASSFVDLDGYFLLMSKLTFDVTAVGTSTKYDGSISLRLGAEEASLAYPSFHKSVPKSDSGEQPTRSMGELYGLYIRTGYNNRLEYWSLIGADNQSQDPQAVIFQTSTWTRLTAGNCKQEVWGGKFKL